MENGKHVQLLVVGADEELPGSLATELLRRGHQVVQARTLDEAVAIQRQRHFDVVLLDWKTAAAALHEPLQTLGDAGCELVLVTEPATAAPPLETLPVRVFGLLGKPISLASLETLLRSAAEHAELKRENRRLQQELRGSQSESGASGRPPPLASVDDLGEVQKAHILDVLRRERGNKSRAARALRVNRRSLYRLLAKYNIRAEDFQSSD